MANELFLAHLEDLISEARTNPNFPLADELASLASVITADEAGV